LVEELIDAPPRRDEVEVIQDKAALMERLAKLGVILPDASS
jgi:hypothetical protein